MFSYIYNSIFGIPTMRLRSTIPMFLTTKFRLQKIINLKIPSYYAKHLLDQLCFDPRPN